MGELGAAGVYGKVTGLGDFICRGLPEDFVAPWDDWLQRGLMESQGRLGEAWQEIYLNSPLWRFLLPRGAFGPSAWAGVLMPSVDRVGRCFPLTAAAPLDPAARPFRIVRRQASWFTRMEDLLLATLDLAPDGLEAHWRQLAGLSPSTSGAGLGLEAVAEGNATWVGLPSVDAVEESFLPLLGSWGEGSTIWWTSGSQLVPPGLWVHRSPPGPEAYTALLDGRWLPGGGAAGR